MDSRNLNQKDLAKMANVGQTTISKWLNSNYSPKVKNLEPLAKALGVTVGDLIGDFGQNQELLEEDKRFLALPLKRKRMLLRILDAVEEEWAKQSLAKSLKAFFLEIRDERWERRGVVLAKKVIAMRNFILFDKVFTTNH